jgi:hypothetical protein
MPLVTCPDCNKEISDAAPACPGCGRPADSKREARAESAPAEKPKEAGERVLFEDGTVKITSARAIVSGKTTYAMSNITSVKQFVEPRPGVFLLAAVIIGGPGLLCVKSNDSGTSGIGGFLLFVGAACVVGFFLNKPKYWVRIGTSGAETNAVYSHDPEWTRSVVHAMNEAIVARG